MLDWLAARRDDNFGVGARIILTGTIEPGRNIAAKAVLAEHEPGMLAGQDQRRGGTACRERMRDRSELDPFGTSADDESNARAGQLRVSKLLAIRRGQCVAQNGRRQAGAIPESHYSCARNTLGRGLRLAGGLEARGARC